MITNNQIALHLIKEDIKYNHMLQRLAEMEVHIEFYPDISTAVLACIAPHLTEDEQQEWTDKYVVLMSEKRGEDYVLEQLVASQPNAVTPV